MTTDDQYTPDEEQVRAWCREGTGDYPDVMDEWLDRFLARVRRDAARQAEAERDEWRQTALDERAAALDALEQIKARDARIEAVERLALAADDGTEYEHNGHDPAEGEAECPGCWALGIRRALDGDA